MILQIKIAIQKIAYLFKESILGFIDDKVLKLSAALSFFTIFSLPPLLIIIISLCGFFFGAQATQGEIFWQIKELVGNDVAVQIQETIKNVTLSNSKTFATAIGVIILIIGAGGVFIEIQDSLNLIWGIATKPKRGVIKFIITRLISFAMIASVGFLLLVGLIINSLTDVLNKRLALHFPKDALYLFYGINMLIVFSITTLLFTLIFKTLPDGKVVMRDCLIGGSFTAFLFMIGKFAMGAYLGSSSIASVYGTAGSVILILVWVYYSAIILYFGAEFTKVYAHTHGQKIVPNAYSFQTALRKFEIEKAQENILKA